MKVRITFDKLDDTILPDMGVKVAFLSAAPQILWRLYATAYDLEQFPAAARWCDEAHQRFPERSAFVQCKLLLMMTKAVPSRSCQSESLAFSISSNSSSERRSFSVCHWFNAS